MTNKELTKWKDAFIVSFMKKLESYGWNDKIAMDNVVKTELYNYLDECDNDPKDNYDNVVLQCSIFWGELNV